MNNHSLIPFGLSLDSDELIDVGSVNRGVACNCICPSCKTPLTARQGDVKEWHFAHRSRGVHSHTKKECEYSFIVSVRLMIRQLAEDGLDICLPEKKGDVTGYSAISDASFYKEYRVTDVTNVQLTSVEVGRNFSGVSVDVVGEIKGIPLVIFITYRGRRVPYELIHPEEKKSGVIELDSEGLSRLFRREVKGKYTDLLRKYLCESPEGKSWVYHPREERLKMQAVLEMEAWKEAQKPIIAARQEAQHILYLKSMYGEKEPEKPVVATRRRYRCVMCHAEWVGTSPQCSACNTHLYTQGVDI